MPPTIIIAPTSPIPRPKPANDAVIKERFASFIRVTIICHLLAFNETARFAPPSETISSESLIARSDLSGLPTGTKTI